MPPRRLPVALPPVAPPRSARRLLLAALLVSLVAVGYHVAPTSRAPDRPSGPPRAALAAGFGELPLYFVTNAGQADPWAAYYVHGASTSVLFGPGGLSFRLWRGPEGEANACPGQHGRGLCLDAWKSGPPPDPLAPLATGERAGDPKRGTIDAVGLTFVGGRAGARPEAEAQTPARFSYFHGRPEDWHTGLATYGRLVYREVWPGIDVVFEGSVQRLKHTFVVQPGADPAAIRLAWQGARGLRVDAGGALVIDIPGGRLTDEAPVAFQIVDGRKVAVEAAYALDAGGVGRTAGASADTGVSDDAGAAGASGDPDGDPGLDGPQPSRSYGFTLGAYDRAQPLYLDPAVLVWAGFIGAAGFDRGLGIALGPQGHVFVTGQSGPDAYVTRLSADGRTLDWNGFVGGSGNDAAFDIDVDGQGAAYITGPTSSLDNAGNGSFPLGGGPDLTFNGGFVDGFVAKVAPEGNRLLYSGYLGGSGTDFGEGIVVDEQGYVYLSGLAESTEATFPVTVGPDLTQNGQWDAYVLKLKPMPDAQDVQDNYAWAGFVGGAGMDVTVTDQWLSAGHIGIDRDHNVYLSGQTTSTEATFPDGDGFGDLPGPDQTFNGGGWDAYVVKIRADGTGLAYAGYIGGNARDDGKGMAVDASGAAYLTGDTASTEATFPVKVGPDLTSNGHNDVFVAKVRPDGSGLEFCGYVGGDDDEQGQGVDLGPDGALYVTGRTEPSDPPHTFPLVVGPDLTHNGPFDLSEDADEGDAFVGRLAARIDDPDPLKNWDFMGLVGGDQADGAFWLDIDDAGNAYIVGDTRSGADTFPDGDGFGGVGGWNHDDHGAGDAFVARIDWSPPPAPKPHIHMPWAGRDARLDEGPPPVVVTLTAVPTPRPTATARPTEPPTPTRAPTKEITPPAGEEVVFFDDFSDPHSGWQESEDPDALVRYIDEQLELASESPLRFVHVPAPGVTMKDGAVEVTARLLQDNDAFYGLMFGPTQGPFLFLAQSNGNVVLAQAFGTTFRRLAGPQISPHIRTGTVANRFRIERDGPRVAIFANGQLLATVNDPALAEPGPVRPMIGTNNDAPAAARFDDFLVTRWAPGRPTPTDVPVLTPTPSPTPPPGGRVVFEDDFANPSSGWAVSESADVRRRYVDGEYEITMLSAERFAASGAPRVACANCTVEVTARFAGDALGIAGLMVGENGQQAIVMFEITSDGRYGVARFDGTNFTTLRALTSSTAIKTGSGETNRLRADRQDGQLTLSANGQRLATLDVAGLRDAGIGGMVAISGTELDLVTRFDDFVMREGGSLVLRGAPAASWNQWLGWPGRRATLLDRYRPPQNASGGQPKE